jgi:hypothetical protein
MFDVAILLPTRGRAEMLERSLKSLVELADNPNKIQIMMGFDNDDTVGIEHFKTVIQPWLDTTTTAYHAYTFAPLGYIRLNEYVNSLALKSAARWLVFWNDDAVMQTQGWDTQIMNYQDQFKLLAFRTHNLHPYSIFPIVPRKWLDLLGYLSPHQISDAWLSQQAFMLDIMERIPVEVLHDRHDLTGNNNDETFKNRPMLEGNPVNPADFHNQSQIIKRIQDCNKIADYLEKECSVDMSFYRNIMKEKQDPWVKLKEYDVNKQMIQFSLTPQNTNVNS